MSSNTKTQSQKTSWWSGLQAEFKKIVWPDRPTIIRETIAVSVISILLGALIKVIDIFVQYGVNFLIK